MKTEPKYGAILLILLTLTACTTQKTYTLKKVGTDIILKGIVQKEVLMNPKVYPWFAWGINDYKPDTTQIPLLKPFAKGLKVLVIAGSWCSDTQRDLPKFYKVAELMGLNTNHISLIMVDRDKKCSNIDIEILQVKNIPAFIFYYEGKEKGRIIENTTVNMETDMVNILKLK
ncbi:MAG: thioredoxin family protein [Bacteroidota bacterium]|nr:thioredoxin family protein [Bacteroidota bacterium]